MKARAHCSCTLNSIAHVYANARFRFCTRMEQDGGMAHLRYLSLFSGIGGFELGIHKVFPNAVCEGFSEIDPKAVAVYKSHFPRHKALGDVRTVRASQLRTPIHLVVGGFPCVNLSSIRGVKDVREGIAGENSGLIFEMLRIIEEIAHKQGFMPRFVFENVFSMRKGDKEAISSLVWGIQPVLINSAFLGPQTRKRYFWCNFPVKDPASFPDMAHALNFGDVLSPTSYVAKYDITGSAPFLRFKDREARGQVTAGFYSVNDTDKPKSNTVVSGTNLWVLDRRLPRHRQYRKMTELEMERLQGFPDGYTAMLESYNARKKALGNAVTVNVIAYIMLNLKNFLQSIS